jgi:hypothetical protein
LPEHINYETLYPTLFIFCRAIDRHCLLKPSQSAQAGAKTTKEKAMQRLSFLVLSNTSAIHF